MYKLGLCATTSSIKYPCVFNQITKKTTWYISADASSGTLTTLTYSVFTLPVEVDTYSNSYVFAQDGHTFKINIATSSQQMYSGDCIKYTITNNGQLQCYKNMAFSNLASVCYKDCTPTSTVSTRSDSQFYEYGLDGSFNETSCTSFTTQSKLVETISNTGPSIIKLTKYFKSIKTIIKSVTDSRTFSRESTVDFNWEVGTELEASGSIGFADVSAKVTGSVGGSNSNTIKSEFTSGSSSESQTEKEVSDTYELEIPGNSIMQIYKSKIRLTCVKEYSGQIWINYPDFPSVGKIYLDDGYKASLGSGEIADAYDFRLTSI
jgi:hypothetical protein